MLRSLTSEQLLRERTFDQYRDEFDRIVEKAIELGDFNESETGIAQPSALRSACEQSMKGGKRLRPIIMMDIARTVSKRRYLAEQMPPVDPADAALAVEGFHVASLIIDDTPAFDNDEERRGEDSVWKSTSPSTALMTAMCIMMGAFQNICRQIDWIRNNCSEWINPDRVGTMMCNRVSQSLGVLGAAGGQFMDMMSESELGDYLESDEGPNIRGSVQTLIQRKTSPFFEIAFVGGWLVGGGEDNPQIIESLQKAGRNFGTAFQIADDIGDMEQDRERHRAGKPGWNYAEVFGREEAEAEMSRRITACRNTLIRHNLHSPLWDEIYRKVATMAVA